jgi:VWFA-related protein
MAIASRSAVFLTLGALACAQQTVPEVSINTHPYLPPSTILHAESNLVETDVSVRDANGRAVGGLRASDFQVFDNGAPQTITAFSEGRGEGDEESKRSAPKFVTFFFDDLHLGVPGPEGAFDLPFVKRAARAFATERLRPGDRMSIATTTGVGDLEFTDDAKLFAEKSDRLTYRWPYLERQDGVVALVHPAEYHQDGVNTLAALESSAKRLAEMPGTRILVLLSAGFIIRIQARGVAYDVEPEIHGFIDAALRANVTVNVIDAKGLSPGGEGRVRRPLKEISEGTGGYLFENSNDIAGAMQLAAHPETTYLIGFNPGERDGKFHTLKIRFKSKRGDFLEFRPGYFSRKDDDSNKKLAARKPMDDAVFSKQTLRDVAADVTVSEGPPKDGAIPVNIGITLDMNRLQFKTANGRHMQQIVFLMTLLDASGSLVAGKESIMGLSLTAAKLASLKKEGLKTVATLTAAPGTYQVRTVIREGMKGSLAASTTAVDLRAK